MDQINKVTVIRERIKATNTYFKGLTPKEKRKFLGVIPGNDYILVEALDRKDIETTETGLYLPPNKEEPSMVMDNKWLEVYAMNSSKEKLEERGLSELEEGDFISIGIQKAGAVTIKDIKCVETTIFNIPLYMKRAEYFELQEQLAKNKEAVQ